jgi:hypothetical protein
MKLEVVQHFVTCFFLRWGPRRFSPKHRCERPHLVGHLLLFIHYIPSYTPYLEQFSSIRDTRTRHALATKVTDYSTRWGIRPRSEIHKLVYIYISCILGLYLVEVGCVSDASEEHTACIIRVEVKNVSHRQSLYDRWFGVETVLDLLTRWKCLSLDRSQSLYLCTHARTHARTHTHTYIYIYIYIYIYRY